MRHRTAAVALILAVAAVGVMALWAGDEAPRALRSTGGLEGLTEVAVQVHLAGGEDWRELVALDDAQLRAQVERLLHTIPGLTVARASAPERTPRLLIVVVGHLIADPQGKKETAATSLTISLNQQVTLRRPLPGGRPALVTATTWQRSALLTGLNAEVRRRLDGKLAKLLGEFGEDHARANDC